MKSALCLLALLALVACIYADKDKLEFANSEQPHSRPARQHPRPAQRAQPPHHKRESGLEPMEVDQEAQQEVANSEQPHPRPARQRQFGNPKSSGSG